MMEKGYVLGIVVTLAIVVVAAAVSSVVYDVKSKDSTKLSDLPEGVGMQVCPASVNSVTLICENENVAYSLYYMSQEKLDEVLANCQEGKIIPTTECMTERLAIYND